MTVCELLLKNRKLFIVERWVAVRDGRSPTRTSRRVTPSPPSTDPDAPYEQAPLPDDLVPSLPPDWEPPS